MQTENRPGAAREQGTFEGEKEFCFLVVVVATFICVHLLQLNLHTYIYRF